MNKQFLNLKPIKLVPYCPSFNPLPFQTEGFKMLTTYCDCNHTTSTIPAIKLLKENIPCKKAENSRTGHCVKNWPFFKHPKQYEHHHCYLSRPYNTHLTSTVNDIHHDTSTIIQISKIKDTACISNFLNQEAIISFVN